MKMKVELEMNGKCKNGEKIVQSVRTEQNIRQFCFFVVVFLVFVFSFTCAAVKHNSTPNNQNIETEQKQT